MQSYTFRSLRRLLAAGHICWRYDPVFPRFTIRLFLSAWPALYMPVVSPGV